MLNKSSIILADNSLNKDSQQENDSPSIGLPYSLEGTKHINIMATQFERFKETLEKMLMLDQADLDFGIYRIMNQKRTDIEKYLNNNLKRQVADAVSNSSTAEVEAVKKEINTLVKTLSDAA